MKPEIDQNGPPAPHSVAPFSSGFAGADLYRENAFRLAELSVEATDREFKRRITAQEGAEHMRNRIPPGPVRVLPVTPPADAARLREIHQRLSADPELRLIDEFFWFWPLTRNHAGLDEGLAALERGDLDGARRLWQSHMHEAETRVVAEHNLAVLEHFEVIDSVRPGQLGRWHASLVRWKNLAESEALWSYVAGRIQRLNDARLRSGAARRFQEWLPSGLLAVNAQLAARLLLDGAERAEEVGWHLAAMRAAFPDVVVDAVLAAEASPRREQIRQLCAGTQATVSKAPEAGLEAARQLLDRAAGPLRVLASFLGEGHPARKAAHDDVAEQVRTVFVGYTNCTQDWSGAEIFLRKALALASTNQTQERVEKDLAIVRENAQETNWWYGPGYHQIPETLKTELDRAKKLVEADKHAEAIRVIAEAMRSPTGSAWPESTRTHVRRILAYIFNQQAVREDNAASDAYNTLPPRLARLVERWRAGNPRTGANCCDDCGGGLYGSYYRRQLEGSDWFFCEGCNSPIQTELDARKEAFKSSWLKYFPLAMLAAEFNLTSKQIAENLKILRERGTLLGASAPTSTLPLRIELGLATEDELYAAALGWFATPARRALQEQYPARYLLLRKALKTRIAVAGGLAVMFLLAWLAWNWWVSRPARLSLEVVGPADYAVSVDGRSVSPDAAIAGLRLPPGAHEVAVTAAGFREARAKLDFAAGRVVSNRFELVPQAGSIRPVVKLDARPGRVSERESEIAQQAKWFLDSTEVHQVESVIPRVVPGKHTLQAEHPRYSLVMEAGVPVEVADAQETTIDVLMVPKNARVIVQTEPRGRYILAVNSTELIINARETSVDLRSGESHTLTLRADGFRQVSREFEAKPGSNEVWRVVMEPQLTDLEPMVTIDQQPAPPGLAAKVTWKIDGTVVVPVGGKLLNIPAGSRKVEVSHPDYETAQGTLEVQDRDTRQPSVNLRSKPARLRLAVSGPDAGVLVVTIDGKADRPSNGVYSLAANQTHKVVLRAPKYRRVEREFTLGSNGEETWQVSLQKVAQPEAGAGWRVPAADLPMQWIAPGEFQMGSRPASLRSQASTAFMLGFKYGDQNKNRGSQESITRENEAPVTSVRLTQGFWLGRTEITRAQWRQVMGTLSSGRSDDEEQPVGGVTWGEAMKFCQALTALEREADRLPDDLEYSLPTEAQWEYACRAGTSGDYAGDLDAIGWYGKNSKDAIHAVGRMKPNAWGLFDMHGNVREWCLDWYEDRLPGGSISNPTGPRSGSYRVARGGTFYYIAAECRSSRRAGWDPAAADLAAGFRLALVPSQANSK